MDKAFKNSQYLYLTLAVICFIGFYKTYFGSFTAFSSAEWVVHCHVILTTTWIFLLILQPILIVQKNIKWHKFIGKLTYYLIPIIVVFMLLTVRSLYLKNELQNTPHRANLAAIFDPFTNTFPFLIFYLLAIKNKNNTRKHSIYMIGTGFALLTSAVWRVFHRLFEVNLFLSFVYGILLTLFLIIAFLIQDLIKGNRLKGNPFFVILLIYFIPNLLQLFIRQTSFWQNFAQWIVINIF
jgi:hypothetical protein